MSFKDDLIIFVRIGQVDHSDSKKKASRRELTCSEKEEKVNKMDKVPGDRRLRKVFSDYIRAADEINHV